MAINLTTTFSQILWHMLQHVAIQHKISRAIARGLKLHCCHSRAQQRVSNYWNQPLGIKLPLQNKRPNWGICNKSQPTSSSDQTTCTSETVLHWLTLQKGGRTFQTGSLAKQARPFGASCQRNPEGGTTVVAHLYALVRQSIAHFAT